MKRQYSLPSESKQFTLRTQTSQEKRKQTIDGQLSIQREQIYQIRRQMRSSDPGQLISQTPKSNTTKETKIKLKYSFTDHLQKSIIQTKRPISTQNQKIFILIPKQYYFSDVEKGYKSVDTYFNKLFRDHFNMSFYHIRSIKPHSILTKPKPFLLPASEKSYTLLFDLDETLIHCNLDLNIPSDKKLQIQITKNETLSVGLNIRPGLQSLLDNLSCNFEMIIFTASHHAYAKKVVEYIDTKKVFKTILSREHCCTSQQGQYVKDLSLIKNRSLQRMLLIDNSAYSYALQVDNGVPILPFYDNRQDKQLLSLQKYINSFLGQDDVKEHNRKNLKMHLMLESHTPEDVFENMKKILNK